MHYVVGLGNPGKEYDGTRHNVGAFMLQKFIEAKNLPDLVSSSKYSGLVSEGVVGEHEVVALFPQTYMNNSGSAVSKLVPKNEINRLILMYDEIDLPLGEFKVSQGKSAGGHNGVDSVISSLESREFVRVRIGIAHKSFWTGKTVRPKGGGGLERYVLAPFSSKERNTLDEVTPSVISAIETIITKGVQHAMNEFN